MCQDSFKGSALLSPSRNVGLGTSSAAGRVGSITSPFVIWLVCKRIIISYTQTSQQLLSVSELYNNLTLWDVKGPLRTEKISGNDMCRLCLWVLGL